jgi:hypothetical protein
MLSRDLMPTPSLLYLCFSRRADQIHIFNKNTQTIFTYIKVVEINELKSVYVYCVFGLF